MRVFWENELIYDNHLKNGKKLIFMENLEIYRYNQVLKGEKFYNVFARSDNDTLIYSMTNEDKTIEWRQIDGIRTKEELKALLKIYFSLGQRKRWEGIKYNVPYIMFKFLLKSLATEGYLPTTKQKGGTYFPEVYYNTWHKNEELYHALMSSYKAGYAYCNCKPDKIYHNIYLYDFKAFHCALLYYMEFPKKFIKVQTDYDLNRLDTYYGLFHIKIKKDDPYLKEFGSLYNSTDLTLKGWFNNIDFRFIEELVGIERFETKTLYRVEMSRLPISVLTALRVCFDWREAETGTDKKFYKLGYEKFCGHAGRRRYYPYSLDYDEENQTFYNENGRKREIRNTFDFDKMDANLSNHNLDLSWNVWVNSYARGILLSIKKHYGGIYGDTDSNFAARPIENIYLSEEHKKNCEHGFILGKFELKGIAKDFKALGPKRYAWIGEDDKVEVKMSGAITEIVEAYIGKDLTKFCPNFPVGVNPYKYIRINAKGEKEYAWRGSASNDRTLSEDKKAIISCAGSGKTTTLIEAVKAKYRETNDPICVIAFTNKNVDELRERIGINSDRLEIRTLDSLAASYLDGAITGDKFEAKLAAATDVLCNGYNAVPVHLFVDEFQDLDLTKFNFINAIPCLSRFYIGDPNQSIYGYSGAMNLFDRLDGFQIEKRSVNYRCAQCINDYGEGFLEETKQPHAKSNNKFEGEVMWSVEVPNDNSIILCRTNEQVDKIKEAFPNRNVMTIHKSKGLTFDDVSVVGINKRNSGEEANIAYVACTRAKNKLTIILEEVV